ncbi:MAG: hypothetical protein OCD01_04225 [Fibrobacterales bacterium]
MILKLLIPMVVAVLLLSCFMNDDDSPNNDSVGISSSVTRLQIRLVPSDTIKGALILPGMSSDNLSSSGSSSDM